MEREIQSEKGGRTHKKQNSPITRGKWAWSLEKRRKDRNPRKFPKKKGIAQVGSKVLNSRPRDTSSQAAGKKIGKKKGSMRHRKARRKAKSKRNRLACRKALPECGKEGGRARNLKTRGKI